LQKYGSSEAQYLKYYLTAVNVDFPEIKKLPLRTALKLFVTYTF